MRFSKETKQKVAGQIVNMLQNNVMLDCIPETFVGWCEDGEVFDWDEDCIALMNKVAKIVDDLSYELDWNVDRFEV